MLCSLPHPTLLDSAALAMRQMNNIGVSLWIWMRDLVVKLDLQWGHSFPICLFQWKREYWLPLTLVVSSHWLHGWSYLGWKKVTPVSQIIILGNSRKGLMKPANPYNQQKIMCCLNTKGSCSKPVWIGLDIQLNCYIPLSGKKLKCWI